MVTRCISEETWDRNAKLWTTLIFLAWMSNPVAAQTVAVDRLGEAGPVVLFLPGLNCHGDLWRPWMEPLAADH